MTSKKTIGNILLILSSTLLCAHADNRYSLSIGSAVFSDFSDKSSSDYLGTSYSVPFSFRIKQEDIKWSLSTSYLTQVDTDATYKGFGDTNLGVSYQLNDIFSVGYKHKFATGDESIGFSSGEDDDKITFDYFDILTYKTSIFASVSHKWVGKGDRTDRQDPFSASTGIGYQVSKSFSLLGSYDYAQSSYINSSDTQSVTLMGSHKINKSSRIGWFVGADDADTYSAGTQFSFTY